jgi:hypothetical protein
MGDANDKDGQRFFRDRIQDTINADTDAEKGLPAELAAAGRPGLDSKVFNGSQYSPDIVGWN